MKRLLCTGLSLFFFIISFAQNINEDSIKIIKEIKDSIYIAETENFKGKDKVLHAEPLFIDLIRDLGARKGEREWNFGFGMQDKKTFDSYTTLVEYEFAPVNRLGFEIELPFTFYYQTDSLSSRSSIPQSKLNGLKLATQFSFYVNEKNSTSLAIGYIHEFQLVSFQKYGTDKLIKGNIYNPFFVAAKRWGDNFHTLLYTGPIIEHQFKNNQTQTTWQVNSNFHYMIRGTRNFIGVELNKEFYKGSLDMIVRPQMRLEISENLLIGIVTGVPIKKENQRFSSFVRLIYEPRHKIKRG
ncbi:MAG: phosphoribosylformylglycinamidine synthase [Chitinophaga sp.]|nr:phosphoribosylformylglycinamidine synthase [Chitinophaga sp.]